MKILITRQRVHKGNSTQVNLKFFQANNVDMIIDCSYGTKVDLFVQKDLLHLFPDIEEYTYRPDSLYKRIYEEYGYKFDFEYYRNFFIPIPVFQKRIMPLIEEYL
jgi:hypothetical protein